MYRGEAKRRHIFVFPSGRGSTLFLQWRAYIPDALFLVPEPHFSDNQAPLSPYSSGHRDILIPGHIEPGKLAALQQAAQPLAQRPWLAAYKGAAQGKPWRLQVTFLPLPGARSIMMLHG